MRVILVDDERLALKTLESFVKEHKRITIVGQARSKKSALKLIKEVEFDVLFLDINLVDGTGFELLDALDKVEFKLVFVTAYDEFAIKAFKYSAVDYLLKPLDPDEFFDTIKRLDVSFKKSSERQLNVMKNSMENKELDVIVISSLRALHYIDVKSIVRLESYKNYTDVFLESGEKITASKTIKHFEELLPKSLFFRVHHQHIINLNFLKRFYNNNGGKVELVNSIEVPVSRRKKEEFLNKINF